MASSSAWLDSVHLRVAGVSAAELRWCQCRRPSLASVQPNVAGVSAGARRWRQCSMVLMVVVEAADAVHSLYRAGTKTPDGGC